MQSLFDFAEEIGFKVEYAPLCARDGECRVDLQRIRLREGMAPRLERWVLAHELGHAVNGHQLTIFGRPEPKQEREADEWAAVRLIDLDTYREVEALREGHVPSMAHDLGIVTKGVLAYQGILARLGDQVYLKPKHGVGQYTAKVTA